MFSQPLNFIYFNNVCPHASFYWYRVFDIVMTNLLTFLESMRPQSGFHTGFFAGGGRSNCKGSASVRKHGHTHVSVRAT